MSELVKKVIELTEYDILEIFGKSGTGKTTFVLEVAKDAVKEGMRVAYIDTERNLSKKEVEELIKNQNFEYGYAPSLAEMEKMIELAEKEKYDILILDSLGLPVLGEFARMNARQRGDALLRIEAILYGLKIYANQNKVSVIVTNQPESEYLKPEKYELRPFGDKGMFYCKEIYKSYLLNSTPYLTQCVFKSWRSRRFGRGRDVLKLTIFEDNKQKKVKVEWLI